MDKVCLCAKCGTDAPTDGTATMGRCGACKTVYYCSAACQKDHWKQHKGECKKLKKAAEAAQASTHASSSSTSSSGGEDREEGVMEEAAPPESPFKVTLEEESLLDEISCGFIFWVIRKLPGKFGEWGLEKKQPPKRFVDFLQIRVPFPMCLKAMLHAHEEDKKLFETFAQENPFTWDTTRVNHIRSWYFARVGHYQALGQNPDGLMLLRQLDASDMLNGPDGDRCPVFGVVQFSPDSLIGGTEVNPLCKARCPELWPLKDTPVLIKTILLPFGQHRIVLSYTGPHVLPINLPPPGMERPEFETKDILKNSKIRNRIGKQGDLNLKAKTHLWRGNLDTLMKRMMPTAGAKCMTQVSDHPEVNNFTQLVEKGDWADISAKMDKMDPTTLEFLWKSCVANFSPDPRKFAELVQRKFGWRIKQKENQEIAMLAVMGGLKGRAAPLSELGIDFTQRCPANPHVDCFTFACLQGKVDFVEELLRCNTAVSLKKYIGRNSEGFVSAASSGHLSIMQVMKTYLSAVMESEDEVKKHLRSIRDDDKQSALMGAICEGHANCIEWLVKQLDWDIQSLEEKSRFTYAMLAAEYRQLDSLKMLHKLGVDLNQPRFDGMTPHDVLPKRYSQECDPGTWHIIRYLDECDRQWKNDHPRDEEEAENRYDPEAQCHGCGTLAAEKVLNVVCDKCKYARYCSSACKKAHWNCGHPTANHRVRCAELARFGDMGPDAMRGMEMMKEMLMFGKF